MASKWYANTLFEKEIKTPLGEIIALADEKFLYLLEFADYSHLQDMFEQIQLETKAKVIRGSSAPIAAIERELSLYFQGKLREFQTPLFLRGTPFQKSVWEELRKTPFGKTRSYSQQAAAIGKPSAYRAVANANGVNRFVIAIPCHRIINANGELGGYNSGLERKKWLLEHERSCS